MIKVISFVLLLLSIIIKDTLLRNYLCYYLYTPLTRHARNNQSGYATQIRDCSSACALFCTMVLWASRVVLPRELFWDYSFARLVIMILQVFFNDALNSIIECLRFTRAQQQRKCKNDAKGACVLRLHKRFSVDFSYWHSRCPFALRIANHYVLFITWTDKLFVSCMHSRIVTK